MRCVSSIGFLLELIAKRLQSDYIYIFYRARELQFEVAQMSKFLAQIELVTMKLTKYNHFNFPSRKLMTQAKYRFQIKISNTLSSKLLNLC